jgi:hypothetical protein
MPLLVLLVQPVLLKALQSQRTVVAPVVAVRETLLATGAGEQFAADGVYCAITMAKTVAISVVM